MGKSDNWTLCPTTTTTTTTLKRADHRPAMGGPSEVNQTNPYFGFLCPSMNFKTWSSSKHTSIWAVSTWVRARVVNVKILLLFAKFLLSGQSNLSEMQCTCGLLSWVNSQPSHLGIVVRLHSGCSGSIPGEIWNVKEFTFLLCFQTLTGNDCYPIGPKPAGTAVMGADTEFVRLTTGTLGPNQQ